MKKAIAALLASFVGLFGYQIVDKTIEARVDSLEYQISSQQEEIESLHHIGKYSVPPSSSTGLLSSSEFSSQFEPSSSYVNPSSSEPTSSTLIGRIDNYVGRKKLMYRLYSTGTYRYIDPSDSYAINEIQVDDNQTYETHSDHGSFSTTAAPNSKSSYLADYYITITSATRTIIDAKEYTSKYYNDDYSIQSRVVGYNCTVNYKVSGIADVALAGKTIKLKSAEATINADGSFKIESLMIESNLNNRFNSLNLTIE